MKRVFIGCLALLSTFSLFACGVDMSNNSSVEESETESVESSVEEKDDGWADIEFPRP